MPTDFADALERDARGAVDDPHIEVDFDSGTAQTRTLISGLPSTENAIPELRILDGNIGYMAVNGMLADREARDAVLLRLHVLAYSYTRLTLAIRSSIFRTILATGPRSRARFAKHAPFRPLGVRL